MRVIAIQDADEKEIRAFGFGEYVGDEVPPSDTGGLGPILHEAKQLNPKIVLDNGDVVWGCECWWGNEERFYKEMHRGRKIVFVSIKEARERQISQVEEELTKKGDE